MAAFIASLIVCGMTVILFAGIILYIVRKIVLKTAENEDKIGLAFAVMLMLVVSFFMTLLCIDIPSALDGGVTVYTNELPRCEYYMHSLRTVSDNPELNHLQGFQFGKYERYGNYRISYTKLNRIVLEVEKLD